LDNLASIYVYDQNGNVTEMATAP